MMSIEASKFSGCGDAKRQSPLGGDQLDKLFSVVFDPNTSKGQVPLRQRKLPQSLFKQSGSNKPLFPKKQFRAPLNSPDANQTEGAMPIPNPAINGIVVAHSRTKSSPAFLQLNHSATNPNFVHTAPLAVCVPPSKQPCLQQSISNSFTMPDLNQSAQPLAGAGSMQNSTLSTNNNNCASLCSLSASNSAQFGASNSFDATLGEALVSNGATCAPVDTGASLGPLPSGWESAVTPEGRVFFIEYVSIFSHLCACLTTYYKCVGVGYGCCI